MPRFINLKFSRFLRLLIILAVLASAFGAGLFLHYRRFAIVPLTIRGENFEIENKHPNWALGLRKGGKKELADLVKKYLGEDGFLKITFTNKEAIQTYIPDSFPIEMRGFEVHATLGMTWQRKTQHLFLGLEEDASQNWGERPLNFYPSFDVFHLFGKKNKDDSKRYLTDEEWENFVFNPLFTLSRRES